MTYNMDHIAAKIEHAKDYLARYRMPKGPYLSYDSMLLIENLCAASEDLAIMEQFFASAIE